MQKLTVKGAATCTTQGHALDVGEGRKRASHSSSCHSSEISFVPLLVETFGVWSCEEVETIKPLVAYKVNGSVCMPSSDIQAIFSNN